MRRETLANLHDAFTDTGHALLLAMVGVALLADRVVGAPRSPANVAIGIAFVVVAVLLLLDAWGFLRPRWVPPA
jgi:hypothetical protein